ncbi:MAG: hypothetical protein Q8R35_00635 [bacterium]|nr:hypothetical protein [bacterium]
MKAKAVKVNPDCCLDSAEIGMAIEGRPFAERMAEEVIEPILGASGLGPAEFYIQECDPATSPAKLFGIEIRLTGLSGPDTAPHRAHLDYPKALDALTNLYYGTIAEHLGHGGRAQLLVSLMCDSPVRLPHGFTGKFVQFPPGFESTLLESTVLWVSGKKNTTIA